MAGFDYGNARLRAMKSRLLSRREIEALVDAGTLKGLIAALAKTAYKRAVEDALARTSGMNCIAQALREDLTSTIGKVRVFYNDDAGETVAIVLRRYDVHNLKTILRGLSTGAAPGEILQALIPVGELSYSDLVELARAPDPRAAVDSLASMNSPFSQPLLKLRTTQPGADTAWMEVVLEQWHYQEAHAYMERTSKLKSVLAFALELEADMANLLTMLRFASAPGERRRLREWLGAEDLALLLVGPGQIDFEDLSSAGMQDNLDAAVEVFAGTRYEPSLRTGLEAFARSGRLSDMEKSLNRFRLAWMAKQISKDPLGVGVVFGYLALKENEIHNIRWIAQGINLGLDASSIRTDLEFVL